MQEYLWSNVLAHLELNLSGQKRDSQWASARLRSSSCILMAGK